MATTAEATVPPDDADDSGSESSSRSSRPTSFLVHFTKLVESIMQNQIPVLHEGNPVGTFSELASGMIDLLSSRTAAEVNAEQEASGSSSSVSYPTLDDEVPLPTTSVPLTDPIPARQSWALTLYQPFPRLPTVPEMSEPSVDDTSSVERSVDDTFSVERSVDDTPSVERSVDDTPSPEPPVQDTPSPESSVSSEGDGVPPPRLGNIPGLISLRDFEVNRALDPQARPLVHIPLESSPFHFALLFDEHTSIGWPIYEHQMLSVGIHMPLLNRIGRGIGTPFHTRVLAPGPLGPPPDPRVSKWLVRTLEEATADMRHRMCRLSLGDISTWSESDVVHTSVTGCSICLVPYPDEDLPAAVLGYERFMDQRVVVLPCQGCHTFHSACLFSWLNQMSSNRWNCPLCRAVLLSDDGTLCTAPSLAEVLREKEQEKGWRCEANQCRPFYEENAKEGTREHPTVGMTMLTLHPCGHSVHFNCLRAYINGWDGYCPSYSEIEFAPSEASTSASDELWNEEGMPPLTGSDPLLPVEGSYEFLTSTETFERVERYVKCPTCHKVALAQLPARSPLAPTEP